MSRLGRAMRGAPAGPGPRDHAQRDPPPPVQGLAPGAPARCRWGRAGLWPPVPTHPPDLDSWPRTPHGPRLPPGLQPKTRSRSLASPQSQPRPQAPTPRRPPRTPPPGPSLPGARRGRPRSAAPAPRRASPGPSARGGSRARRGWRSAGPQLGLARGQTPPGHSAQPRGQPSPPVPRPVRKAGLAGDATLRPALSDREFSHWPGDPARPGNRRRLDGRRETPACHRAPGVSVPDDDRPLREVAEARAPAGTAAAAAGAVKLPLPGRLQGRPRAVRPRPGAGSLGAPFPDPGSVASITTPSSQVSFSSAYCSPGVARSAFPSTSNCIPRTTREAEFYCHPIYRWVAEAQRGSHFLSATGAPPSLSDPGV